jgi:hypothetical protein
MGLTTIETEARPEANALALAVEVAAMAITVKAGSFRIAGVDYELVEDQEFSATADEDEDTSLLAHLVVDKSDDSVVLLVDERVGDEEVYDFPHDDPYRLLELVYWAKIPPGTTDLADAEVQVRTIVAPPPSPEIGPPTPPE